MKVGTLACKFILIASLAAAAVNLFADNLSSPRERLLLDFGWRFHLGDSWSNVINLAKAGDNSGPAKPDFPDADWRTVNLPHDWAVELPFDSTADYNHGFKPVGPGFPENDIAWYRRTFELPGTDAGKRLWLQFDGVYRDCDVFVNGWFIGHHDDGYDSFRYDITDVARPGARNVIAVRVNASQFEGWFYEGAGIYRHVWLVKTSPLAIAPDGIFVYSQFKNNVPGRKVTIQVQAQLLNCQTNSAGATVHCEIISPEGKSIKSFKGYARLKAGSKHKINLDTRFQSPELWSPESPKLYTLITTVESGGRIVDRKETEFGIRTVAFDPDKGFLLNGKHYEIKGTCNHQDAAGVGEAVPDALQYFRIRKLKEMGCNAYRTSHNAPTPELLEACDRLGMLVLDENRLFGSDAANLARFKGQIERDRNHPCVFAWSLGNEEWNAQDTPTGAAVVRTMQDLAHSLDPTRLCTMAVNSGSYGNFGIFSALDVKGFNYHFESMDAYHAAFPKADILGTEQASTIGTRGIYTNDASRGYVSSYDENNPRWGQTAEVWWSYFDARPWASGGFVWTGFDYRGEPTPYQWPCINSHFGILDTCGFPKDNFWYYRAWWTTNVVLHLLPHWNWPGKEDRNIPVWCYSNCKQVELFLNGRSLGRKTMDRDSHLAWMVKYEPGTLLAKGYDSTGRQIAQTKVETTGAPAVVELNPDRSDINADGQDVSVIAVSVTDAKGRVVPVATNLIHFELSGPGKIIGVGNGDPACHEPDVYLAQYPRRTVSINDGWRSKTVPDVQHGRIPEFGANYNDSTWDTAEVRVQDGPMAEHSEAVYRVKFQVSQQDLAADRAELTFGRIDDDGFIYVNGRHIGDSHVWENPVTFDIKPFLHEGENSIAVGVNNNGGPGGVARGVNLVYCEPPIEPHWQRSAFNGLAQVIVQSTKTAGDIKLTAQAEGLSPATLVIHSSPCTPRPCEP